MILFVYLCDTAVHKHPFQPPSGTSESMVQMGLDECLKLCSEVHMLHVHGGLTP